jgi:predicted RNA-binding Zn ribbon-like protein
VVTTIPTQPGGRRPAPGPLALVQAFVNTNDIEGGSDRLAQLEEAHAWLRERALLEKRETLDEAERVWLLEVREAIRALALANNGRRLDDRAVTVLDDAARRTLTIEFGKSGTPLRPTGDGAARAVGSLLAIVAEAMREGTWARMKACRYDGCRWLFYDHSRNRVSSWCSMTICGNRAKTRAYRRRRARRPPLRD